MKRIEVLDHGYIELIDSWGSDERIVESARMSTAKGFQGWFGVCQVCGQKDLGDYCRGPRQSWTIDAYHHQCGSCKRCGGYWFLAQYPNSSESTGLQPYCLNCNNFCEPTPGDEKLLSTLWNSGHTSPFEQAGAVFEVQAPIFVFREWHRHRTQSYNEHSARYSPLPALHYVPNHENLVERAIAARSATNKQAQASRHGKQDDALYPALFSEQEARLNWSSWLTELEKLYEHADQVYEAGLRFGIPKELARLPVPVARYSKMRAQALLWNWLHFLNLREDQTAQWEIRQYANALHSLLQPIFPRTFALFEATQTLKPLFQRIKRMNPDQLNQLQRIMEVLANGGHVMIATDGLQEE